MQNRLSSHRSLPKVAIIGAGVSGLGIGWRLAQAGCRVDAYDRGKAGMGASWAAAGMLAAQAEAEPGETALLALNLDSQRRWPDFARELEAATGQALGYRDEGTLIVAMDRDDAEHLRFQFDLQQRLGLDTQWLAGGQARRMEPFLSPNVTAAVFSPADHQVDNRLLGPALAAAFRGAGGRLHEACPVDAIELAGGRVEGLRVGDALIRADVVVLAAGAWSRGIPGLPDFARPPVRPLKGQLLALAMDPRAPLLDRVLWVPEGVYLVPRRDGRLILGATVEEKGFEDALTAGGLLHLLREAWEALPGIDELRVVETWVGHRPTSRDDAPILGPAPIDGLVVATGHHRNGILLTPVTADAVSHYILTGTVVDAIRPFGPDRFAPPASTAAGGAA